MSRNLFKKTFPFLLSGIFSFLIIGFLTKSDLSQQNHLPDSLSLAMLLLFPIIAFMAALYFVFRPKISLENGILWFVSFASLHIFAYFATFYAIIKVYLQNENLSFLVGGTISGMAALVARFILKKVLLLESRAKNSFIGGFVAWVIANAFQSLFVFLKEFPFFGKVEFYMYGFASVYLFWQLAIGYECTKCNAISIKKNA